MTTRFEKYLEETGEVGFVERVTPSVIYAEGLPGAKLQELVIFESGEVAEVMTLSESSVELLSFSRASVRAGSRVVRTDRFLETPVGEELLGALVSPLGHSLDHLKPLPPILEQRPLEVWPRGVNERARIKRPCETGVSLVDLILPLGKGQRELIIGDQKTGKSLFLLRTLLTQVRQGVIGIYAVIGKSQIGIRKIQDALNSFGIAEKVVIVASSADDPAGTVFLTPYTAMTIAEYFCDRGRDVLVVLDDLSTHAKVWREITLLGKKFPGRNSYPGDIFYVHSRLMERAGNFKTREGERAITCLPVVETAQGDLTGYIQTNLMAMTDGHLFFDHALFIEGRRPAIDPFLSVTRVGRQTQSSLRREVASVLTPFLKTAQGLRSFTTFGEEAGEHIKRTIEKEKALWIFFDQTVHESIAPSLQLFLWGLVWGGTWRGKTDEELRSSLDTTIYMYEKDLAFRSRVDREVAGCNSVETLVSVVGDLRLPASMTSN